MCRQAKLDPQFKQKCRVHQRIHGYVGRKMFNILKIVSSGDLVQWMM